MRSNLDENGKLLDPMFLVGAKVRRQQLGHEIARIDVRLNDKIYAKNFPDDQAYSDWHHRASDAQRYLKLELDQLEVWIAEKETQERAEKHLIEVESLLDKAYKLLKMLHEEVDFDPEELVVISDLDAYYAGNGVKPQDVSSIKTEVVSDAGDAGAADAADAAAIAADTRETIDDLLKAVTPDSV